ncbi:RHS repeat-associated core domain-containing protein [Acidiphilium iwatense]|uniref:Teneurin-like YD-shell domain-containing protein n=1 Tax=Acidiphilium iwatense TaxID=768198 RepID=A0ABS9DSP4_9PROT|nr:RHS repeat-associated core domain-containing protein [Acidiphilium iwatense]MCF3945758.1 hypothetical protein [Acidiphilium iwatense]
MNRNQAMGGHGSPRHGHRPWHALALLGAVLLGTMILGPTDARAASTITRTSSWTYDPNTGLVTSQTIEPGSADAVTTSYTYDAYGNKTAVTVSAPGVQSRTTTTTYDSNGEFVTKVTNALNQSETWSYDPRFGVPDSHTGPNGLTTSWVYDSLGRKDAEFRPNGTVVSWVYFYQQPNDALGTILIYKKVGSSGVPEAAPTTITGYDTLGRVIQNMKDTYAGTTVTDIIATTQYNALGQVYRRSLPYIIGSGSTAWTTFTYDALGRVVSAQRPDGGTTTYAYNGLTTSVTDAQGRTTTTTKNDMGLPVAVTDAAGSTTRYSYDAVGDLLQIQDPNNNFTEFTYDTEGHKLTMADPDRGQWSYSYDALGELVGQTDADGNLTTFTYDQLGRMLTRDQPDQDDTWVYDSATDGIGKLGAAYSVNVVNNQPGSYITLTAYTYDSAGRLTKTTIAPNNGMSSSYSYVTTYDAGGRISTVTYPSGFEVQYSYSAIGTLSKLTDVATGQALWTLDTTNAAEEVTQETLGNGVVVNNTYDPNSYRLTGTTAGLNGTSSVANFTYSYDNLGDLTGRTDANEGLTESFTYDNLYRLTGYTLNNADGTTANTIAYDGLGDIIYKSDVGSYSYPAAYSGSGPATHPHAVAAITNSGTNNPYNLSTTYSYDADGNQLAGDGATVSWTGFNMVASIARGSATATYAYGPDHNRIMQSIFSNGVIQDTTTYLRDPASGLHSDLVIGGSGTVTWDDYIVAGGELLGMHVTPPTGSAYDRYFIRDQLGSIAVLTDDAGNVVERDSYDAWGKRRNPNGTDDVAGSLTSQTTRGFTGHEHIDPIGLINMNARVYDPLTGRFMSPDPVIQQIYNLQNLNPYSYVDNNPLSITDPTGMCGGFFGCFFSVITDILFPVKLLAPLFEQVPILGDLFVAGEGLVCGPLCAGAAAAEITGFETGSLGQALKAGVITTATAEGFQVVGQLTDGGANSTIGQDFSSFGAAAAADVSYLAQVAGDGLVGGLSSIAQGGGFQSGFLAAGFSSAAGQTLAITGNDNLLTASVTGGIGSVIGGGKFANGAETGAFGYLFNRCSSGCFTRISASINATLAYIFGDSLSASVGVNWPNDGHLSELQLFGEVSEDPLIGVGAYAGIGGSVSFSDHASLYSAGITNEVNLYGEGDVGAGPGGGLSVTGRSDLSSPGYSLSQDGPGGMTINLPKVGIGVGAYVGGGVSLNSTAATPQLGQW